MKNVSCFLLSLYFLVVMSSSPLAHAQDANELVKTTQEDMMTVIASGAGGAVIGLSTLSFVDKPSKKLTNIWTGAAIGIIAGVIVVAYNSAQRNSEDLRSSVEFNSSERYAWHSIQTAQRPVPETIFGTNIFQLNF